MITLAALRRIAMALPEVGEQPHFHFGSWRVRGKIFATLPPGGTHVHVFVPEAVRDPLLAMHPAMAEKLHWGGRVVGLKVTLAAATSSVMKALLRQAWAGKAPKTLSRAASDGAGMDKIEIQNVNTPGRLSRVNAARYDAMRAALLKALPAGAPGLTQSQMREAVLPQLPQDLFPNGDKSMWWVKAVQLDLEAKGLVLRDASKEPLRWTRGKG